MIFVVTVRGGRASIKIHDSWKEPIILWSVVMAHKGQKKSPALGCFNKQLTDMDETLTSSDSEHPPQIFVEHFSFEELQTQWQSSAWSLWWIESLVRAAQSIQGRAGWQEDHPYTHQWWLLETKFSFFHEHNEINMVQSNSPATVVEMCNSKDDDGLMDRQLFACPNEIHYDYDEYLSQHRA